MKVKTVGQVAYRVVCDGGRGPNRVQYALKQNQQRYGGWLKAKEGTETSVEVKQSVKKGQNAALGWVCESTWGDRVSAPVGEHTWHFERSD